MGRAPCCDKANVKKGPWSPEEDSKLKDYIEKNGTGGNWIALPQKAGLRRCGKSCRLRWLNYLRPNIRHGDFSEEEDRVICSLYATIGSRWSIIAAQLPGRTDNDIKNYWNTKLKKKLMAFAASSSTTASSFINGITSFQRTATGSNKPPSMYSSSQSDDPLSSLYSYNYASHSNSGTTKELKPLMMDEPTAFSCHQMITSSSNTSSCLETSTLSLFQNHPQYHQYYQPLLMFGSGSTTTDHQQTSCSSNNSDNGVINKQHDTMGSFHSFNNKSSSDNNNVVIVNRFDEEDDQNKGFVIGGYEDISNNNVFLSQFDNMNSSSTDEAALMNLYDIESGNKQLSMNINNLSLINIGDNNQNQQQQVVNSKITSLDQPMMKEKDQRMMMMYCFNSKYDHC